LPNRARRVILREQHQSQCVPRLDVLWVEMDRVLEGGARGAQIAALESRRALGESAAGAGRSRRP